MKESKDMKMGVEWGYLKTLLNLYGNMLESYSRFLLYQNKLASPNEKKIFFCSMSAFYTSVMANFDTHLESKEDTIKYKPVDYLSVANKKDEDLIIMYSLLCKWTQTDGPFATMTETNNPYKAFER